MASIINSTTTAGVTVTGDNSGSLQLATNNGTTAVTIDTSQNVGIGTTTPANKVHIQQTSAGASLTQLVLQNADNTSGTGSAVGFANHTSSGLLTGKVESAIDGGNAYSMRFYTYQSGLNERMRIDADGNLKFNSGYGSVATAYGCRAWCSLNGTGTIAIRGSGNISSVTDLGTGNYQYNFATAMPDANYGTSYSDYSYGVGYTDNFQTTSFRSQTLTNTFASLDTGFVQVAVFR